MCTIESVYCSENRLCPLLCQSNTLLKDSHEASNTYQKKKKSIRDPQKDFQNKIEEKRDKSWKDF